MARTIRPCTSNAIGQGHRVWTATQLGVSETVSRHQQTRAKNNNLEHKAENGHGRCLALKVLILHILKTSEL